MNTSQPTKTGDAKIDRQGQTKAAGSWGSDPMVQAARRPAPTDLNP